MFLFLLWSLKSKGHYHYESDNKACQNVRFVNWNAEKTSLKVLKYSQLIYYIYDRKWKMDESDSKRWNFVDGLNWVMDNDYRNISGFFFDRARKTTFFRLSWWKFFFLNWQICWFFLVEECCWRKNNSYYTLYRRIYWFWFWW